jgi:transposase
LDWLPEDDLAYFILEVVSTLDLRGIEDAYQEKDARGTRPYAPRMLTALLVYGYCVGVRSSRRIEAATWRDVAFRVIAGGEHPDHSVISEFRRVHLSVLGGLFVTTVRLAQRAGLVRLGQVALDGTKVQANASKHKAMSHGRMLKTEAELRVEIERMLAEAEQADREEDAIHGVGRRGDELPAELRRRTDRLHKIEEARAALEAEAREARARELAEQAERQRTQALEAADPVERKRAATRAEKAEARASALRSEDEDPPCPGGSSGEGWPGHQIPTTPEGKPVPQAQRNFTDPDSRIMKRDGAYLQGYNCQAAVDGAHQIIVGCMATNQSPDQQHLPPAMDQVREICGAYPQRLLADAGYWDAGHVEFCAERGMDAYIATGRQKHGEAMPVERGEPPGEPDARGGMNAKLRTPEGRQVYARRKVIVEPVFGQIREGQEFRRFLLRGLEKARGEWALVCAGHNLLKLFRAAKALPA